MADTAVTPIDRSDWDALFTQLRTSLEIVSQWAPETPNPSATRCEQSKHRTLAHLRACQEQWMEVVQAFLEKDSPSVTVLHPWRKFEQGRYAEIAWEEHLSNFSLDRQRWLGWQDVADWSRTGKMNRKPLTVGELTQRLARHEEYHLTLFDKL